MKGRNIFSATNIQAQFFPTCVSSHDIKEDRNLPTDKEGRAFFRQRREEIFQESVGWGSVAALAQLVISSIPKFIIFFWSHHYFFFRAAQRIGENEATRNDYNCAAGRVYWESTADQGTMILFLLL